MVYEKYHRHRHLLDYCELYMVCVLQHYHRVAPALLVGSDDSQSGDVQ